MTQNKVIAACAGSGKTYQLIQRMLELLEQESPGNILAITFTKKAAAEIHQRLLEALTEKAQEGHGWAQEKRRRILLAETAADKIHIYTFHSWFHFLLSGENSPQRQRQLIESETALREEAWRRWLKNPEIYLPLQDILTYCSPLKLKSALFGVTDKINAWRLYSACEKRQEVEEIKPAKEHLLNTLKKFIEIAGDAPPTVLNAKEAVEMFLAGDETSDWRKSFFTQKDEVKKTLLKAADKNGDGTLEILNKIAAADQIFREKVEKQLTIQFDEKMTILVKSFLREYENIKDEENVMTFNDLEYEVYMAAAESGHNKFLTRVNRQFRHILIDEFQDSSPLQWRIVYYWLKKAAADEKPPSVFIVGDKQQAIYRFRNGDARMLDEATKYLCDNYQGVSEESKECRRCAPPILNLVNAVFPDLKSTWLKSNENLPGRVEWNEPPVSEPPAVLHNPRNPLKTPPTLSGKVIRHESWATEIGERLVQFIGKVGVGEDNRPCQPEDIMVLFPQLTHAKELIKVFEQRGLSYSIRGGGISFLHSFACRDILALLAVLLSTKNSLSLAQVLKSPLFSFSESQLADVADVGDTQTDLWQRLMNSHNPATNEARACLGRWCEWAQGGVLPAHDLLSKIYTDGEVLSRYAAAVATESRPRITSDLSALLDFSLNNDGGRKPLLQQFLSACAAAIKERTPPSAGAGGGIQMMTVHSAKGLEKPVVVIADTSFGKRSSGDLGNSVDLLIDWPTTSAAPTEFIFRPRKLKQAFSELVKNAEELQEIEYENLLYVAMTRACQFLLIFSTDEPNNARAENLQTAMHAQATNNNGVWAVGVDLPIATPTAAKPPPTTAPPPSTAAVGIQRTGAAKRGEDLHCFVALLLAGLSEEEAMTLAAPTDKTIPAAARKILAEPTLHNLLTNCAEFYSEAEFVDDGKIHRLDLLIVGKDGIVWIVDYKSSDKDLSRYDAQLQKYRQIIGKRYPPKNIRTAIVSANGQWHEITPPPA